ncbi:carbohydrate ABC transporter permease [Paenibacillus sp. PL2-23]|uniref:carbohydrate ABC transporter permease n=1 Tax=Paenibacillus sp. PL2-23 TaxID=2100729 RepID=UPI0030F9198F
MKSNQLAQHWSDRWFDRFNLFLLSLLLIIFVYPLLFIVSASISNPNLVIAGEVWLLPKGLTLDGYKHILEYSALWVGYRNTIMYVAVGVPLSVLMTVCAAYPLSRRDFMIRNTVMGFFVFTMFFGGGMIPTYLLVKSLGLLDTFLAIIVPSMLTVWNIILTRTYFQSNIPDELWEAASIDGCTNFKFLWSIVMPLSKPILAVMVLFYAVAKWNLFFDALIYLSDRSLYPLQLILRDIIVSAQLSPDMLQGIEPSQQQLLMNLSNSMRYGVIIVASIPVMIMYPFIQKHFVKGMLVGSLKG